MIHLVRRFLRRPKLSVVVVVYDMGREAPRTLRSLAMPYQIDISEQDYEIIVMDNGSPQPLGKELVQNFGPQFRYQYVENASQSPAAAINQGVALSRGSLVGIYIDGARLASPGLLSTALRGFCLYDDPIVATLGWHLGPEVQQKSVHSGYCKQVEEALLESIGWPLDGYRLFDISTLALSSRDGYFTAPSESNAVFMRRNTFIELHGFDVAFDEAGGGLLNLDFFIRALERTQSPLVMLLGEGTFHQLHGGASTSAQITDQDQFQKWAEKYHRLRGKPWQHPVKTMTYIGKLSATSYKSLCLSVERLRTSGQPNNL
ncbi:MAG: glycosyltransferase family 2 protein [Gammaproteobacteria bacterium]|nr:glycosyltransferase family 2 protein [Gammaproteobacteria bacterium]